MKDQKEIDKLVKKIEKDFGAGTVIKLDSKYKLDVDVISTGLYSLDLATGVGGLPRGRIVEIYGQPGSGKTTLALNVVREAQKAGGKAAYIDMENAVDVAFAKEKIGVDVEDLLFSQPNGGEEALQLLETYILSGLVDVVVVDSVATLLPTAEAEGDIGSTTIGLQARLMSSALRKIGPAVKKSNTLVIFINQTRQKIGGSPYSNPNVTSGGVALQFYCGMRVEMARIAWVKDGDVVTGSKIKAKITKSKVSPPFKQAEFILSFKKGLWKEYDLFNTAVKYGILEKDGNTYMYGKEKLGVGVNQSCKELEDNKELAKKLVDELGKEDLQEPEKETEEEEE
jgi:recombination protein RecA